MNLHGFTEHLSTTAVTEHVPAPTVLADLLCCVIHTVTQDPCTNGMELITVLLTIKSTKMLASMACIAVLGTLTELRQITQEVIFSHTEPVRSMS